MQWNRLIPWLSRLPKVCSSGPYTVEHVQTFEEPCPCCGEIDSVAAGWINGPDGSAVAMYDVRWKHGLPDDHGGVWSLVLGPWDERATRHRRALVSLVFSKQEGRWQYMVLDAKLEPAVERIAAIALRRDEVIGTPFAKHVFDMVDAILLHEPALEEIRHYVYHV